MSGMTKLIVLEIAMLITCKWLLVGILVQEATFDGEEPQGRI